MAYCSKGRVCITMKKTSQLVSPVDINPTENFDFSEALESVYPLLEIVFSYLDFEDLRTASEVKKSWENTANKVLQKRNEVSWVTVFRKKRQSHVHCSNNYPYNNMGLGIVFFNFCAVSLNDIFCCHENLSQRKIRFADFLSEQVVPLGMDYCVIGCPGVASMFSKKIIKKSSLPLFDCCFLPAIPNIRISMFYCDPKCLKNDHIRPEEKLKCLLLFCKNDLEENVYTVLENVLPEQDFKNVALGGGIIRRTMLYPLNDRQQVRKLSNLCIAFTEDIYSESTCDTSSIVINGNNLSSEDFENELLEFKRQITVRNQSVAFRVCCAAKARKTYELRVFNKIFPNTPLLGMEADGEIGWDCFNKPGTSEILDGNKAKKPKRYPNVQHQWSTVIVFITWGQIVHDQK